MKKLLTLTACAAMMALAFNASAAKPSYPIQIKSQTEAQLVDQAKKEGQLVVYSISGRISKAAKSFEDKYGIKVLASNMKDFQLISKITAEAKSKVENGADLVLCQDSGRVWGELIATGLLENYVPAELKNKIDPKFQSPLVFAHMNKVMLYNNETYKDVPIKNVWALTDPKMKGKFFFKSPMEEGINCNFLTMLTTPENAKALAKAYKDYYKKDIKLTTKNAGYEWIKGVYKNGLVMGSSDTSMTEAIGVKGQNIQNIGILNFSKIRYAEKKNLALGYLDQVQPFSGFYYPEYLMLVKGAKNKAAAKLFILHMMTKEGFSPWAKDLGTYSGNNTLPPAKGDKTLKEWSKSLIGDDPKYIFENRTDVEEFVSNLM